MFGAGCTGSEGPPPVGSTTKPLVKVMDQVPCKRGSGDPGQSPPVAEGFCAMSSYFILQRCIVLLCYASQVVSLLLSLNWNYFRPRFFWVRRPTELFSLGAFAHIAPKKSAPMAPGPFDVMAIRERRPGLRPAVDGTAQERVTNKIFCGFC